MGGLRSRPLWILIAVGLAIRVVLADPPAARTPASSLWGAWPKLSIVERGGVEESWPAKPV
jgi:hypothetical protein